MYEIARTKIVPPPPIFHRLKKCTPPPHFFLILKFVPLNTSPPLAIINEQSLILGYRVEKHCDKNPIYKEIIMKLQHK
jgi:hypothetical protein